MSKNLVSNYGWASKKKPNSSSYINSKVISLLKKYKGGRVADIGSGNGALCQEMFNEGFEVVGVEYDKHGVEISNLNYPKIPFYNFGVQDDPEEI